MNKTARIWDEAREWCITHPGQKYMIARLEGGFIVTWEPTPKSPQGRIWFDGEAEVAGEQEPQS